MSFDTAATWFTGICFAAAAIFILRWLWSVIASTNEDYDPMSGGGLMIPDKWDEHQIALGLERLSGQPTMLAHFVTNVKARFIEHQNIKTVRRRTDFLEAKINALQKGKEYLTLVSELQRLRLQEEAKDIEAQMALTDAQHRQQNQHHLLNRQQQLAERRIDLELAQVDDQLREIQKKSQPLPPKASPEEERARKRTRLKEDIDRLQQEKLKAMQQAPSDEDRMRTANMYDNAIERLYDELSRVL